MREKCIHTIYRLYNLISYISSCTRKRFLCKKEIFLSYKKKVLFLFKKRFSCTRRRFSSCTRRRSSSCTRRRSSSCARGSSACTRRRSMVHGTCTMVHGTHGRLKAKHTCTWHMVLGPSMVHKPRTMYHASCNRARKVHWYVCHVPCTPTHLNTRSILCRARAKKHENKTTKQTEMPCGHTMPFRKGGQGKQQTHTQQLACESLHVTRKVATKGSGPGDIFPYASARWGTSCENMRARTQSTQKHTKQLRSVR